MRKAKTQMELNLARIVKNNKDSTGTFVRTESQGESTLINEKGEMATMDREKAEALNKVFALVFTDCQATHFSYIPEPLGGSWRSVITHTVKEKQD